MSVPVWLLARMYELHWWTVCSKHACARTRNGHDRQLLEGEREGRLGLGQRRERDV